MKPPPLRRSSPWSRALVHIAMGLVFASPLLAGYRTAWIGSAGSWTDIDHWDEGVPTVFTEAVVSSHAAVVIPSGKWVAAMLTIGNQPGDRARVELDGGELLLRQDSLRIGEYTDSEGTFILNGGALHCAMDVFVGAATASSHRQTKADLIIRGGSFVAQSLVIGQGLGADSSVLIEGSRATAVCALDSVSLSARADPAGKPGRCTLTFTLDEHGVTPITIQSRWRGLELQRDETSHCTLGIALGAVPPRDDITLIRARVASRGQFDGCAEGAEVVAAYAGRTYRWQLSYHGGTSGHDLVLRNCQGHADDAPRTPVLAPSEPPIPLWQGSPVYPLSLVAGKPAFPGAEGYGAFTSGGSGGREISVDNLNDEGPGSLRAAVDAEGPRMIVFRTTGIIRLVSPLVIRQPGVTIDGATAPLPGITLTRHGLEIQTHDVVLRHLRVRIGDEDIHRDRNLRYAAGDGEYALYFVEGAQNCIADHLSLSWSTNKLLSTTKMSDRITIQWCILSESLNIEGHGYASITGGNRVTWHHNLFAHNQSRNVRFQGAVDADFRNNVIYDWGDKTSYGEFDRLNYVGNYLKAGPSTTQRPRLFHDGEATVLPASIFLADNAIEDDARATADNWKGTRFYFDRARLEAPEPFPAPAVATDSPAAAFERVLAEAGATQPARDTVDQRIIKEVRTGSGRIVDSVAAAGGWPDMEPSSR
jgi:hypothetical protein